MTEFNLSEHETYGFNDLEITYPKSYVKEFIRLLKEELCLGCRGKGCSNCIRINKLAGDKLK
jgi:hypothetical protein